MMKKLICFVCIACLFFASCSDDKDKDIARYLIFVTQEKSFSSQDIQKAYPEIFNNYPFLSSFVKDIRVIAINYWTKDVNNKDVVASGIIAYPAGEIKGITSIQHSTLFLKSQAPSLVLLSPEIIPVFFNQIVVMADYIGFGKTHSLPHPFMQSSITGHTCLDMIRAGKEYLTSQGFQLPEEITLAGYSQGGSATLALLREMENSSTSPWKVKQVYAGGGVYDFTQTYQAYLKQNIMSAPAFAPYLILGLNTKNEMQLDELFIDPPKIESLYDGQHGLNEINYQLGNRLDAILHPDFYTAAKNTSIHRLDQLLAANTLLNWIPEAPITFMHSPTDDYVPYFNSQKAFDEFQKRGCNVKLTDLKGDHATGAINFFIKILLNN